MLTNVPLLVLQLHAKMICFMDLNVKYLATKITEILKLALLVLLLPQKHACGNSMDLFVQLHVKKQMLNSVISKPVYQKYAFQVFAWSEQHAQLVWVIMLQLAILMEMQNHVSLDIGIQLAKKPVLTLYTKHAILKLVLESNAKQLQ